MAKFLKIQPNDLIVQYYGKIVEEDGKEFVEKYEEDRRTPCPFLGDDKNCKIYPVRPDPCRLYPIDTDFGRCGIDCPGMENIFNDVKMQKEEDMTHSLDLLFLKPLKGQLPGPPLAQIYIKTYTRDKKGYISITPHCVSLREVEGEINRLKEELEIIRKKAKQKFANADK
jgi:Fe-S-cluster containining protein